LAISIARFMMDDVRRAKQAWHPHATSGLPVEAEVRASGDGVRLGALLDGERVAREVAEHATGAAQLVLEEAVLERDGARIALVANGR
jgi:hypothetical protein